MAPTPADYARFECLIPGASAQSCTCENGLDAAPRDTCHSPGDDGKGKCPQVVLDFDPRAQCFPLDPDGISLDQIEELRGCSCGCPAAVARCDGLGVAFGAIAPAGGAGGAVNNLLIQMPKGLPNQGDFGLYVRARGLAVPLTVYVVATPDPGFPEPNDVVSGWSFFLADRDAHLIGASGDGYEAEGKPLQNYHYESISERPTGVVIVGPLAAPGEELFAAYEIDCVIPFVVEQ